MRAAVAALVLAGGCVLAVPGIAGAAEPPGAGSARAAGPSGQVLPDGGDAASRPAGDSHEFPSLSAAEYLSCDGSAKITGTFDLGITGVTGQFKRWTNGDHKQKFTASLGLTTTISASVDVTADTVCTPKAALEKVAAATFVIDGVVVTVELDFYLTISADGSIRASQSVTQTATLTGRLGVGIPTPTYTMTKGKPVVRASGTADFTAVIGGQADITAGVLKLDFALMGGVEASATVESGQVCLTGYPALRAVVSVGVPFFDWKKKLLDKTWEITSIDHHGTEFGFGTCTPPVIATTALPAGTVGEKYSARLATVGNREGTWKLASGELPPQRHPHDRRHRLVQGRVHRHPRQDQHRHRDHQGSGGHGPDCGRGAAPRRCELGPA